MEEKEPGQNAAPIKEKVIQVNNITKRYPKYEKKGVRRKKVGEIPALDDVSLDVKKGEILGVLGPNGAGKTTLIKVLAGVLMQDEGSASVNGFDTVEGRMDVRRSISLLRRILAFCRFPKKLLSTTRNQSLYFCLYFISSIILSTSRLRNV